MVKAFISYSWESEIHKGWVRDLSIRLRKDWIDITLDQWDLVPGDQLPEFMERAVRESDFILIVCTRQYKNRSDNRQGGVGYEGDIMTSEVMNSRNHRKFIPILRQAPWEESAPSWLSGKYYIDLSSTPISESQYEDLLNTLLGTRTEAPPLGGSNIGEVFQVTENRNRVDSQTSEFIPIRISGVIVDQVGIPRNDDTRGSGLYRVPFRLTQQPPSDWSQLFLYYWDHPSRFTTMHRPGIASVVEDTVILNGTSVEEVENYHRETLILASQEANKKYQEVVDKKRSAKEGERKCLEDHRRNVENISRRIKFDDEPQDT